jgi:RNA polymerase sigma factor (sigma-70 family)
MATEAIISTEAIASDHDLLDRFVRSADREAFERIVLRHARVVAGVCRRNLASAEDQDDAFQATFLVLARKAGSIRRGQSLASWLYGVAYRTALQANRRRCRRREEILIDVATGADDPFIEIARRQEQRAVDEELHQLPEKYRTALLLRYLSDRSNEQIAEELQISVSAVEGRLKRGKAALRRRLARRGIAYSAAFLAIALSQQAAMASEMLVRQTVAQAIAMTTGILSTGSIGTSGGSIQLAQSVEVTAMTLLSTKTMATSVAAAVFFFAGVVGIAANVADPTETREFDRLEVVAANHKAPSESDADDAATIAPSRQDESIGAPANSDAGAVGTLTLTPTTTFGPRGVAAIEGKLNMANPGFQFIETPLQEVTRMLAEIAGIPVILDVPALNDEGIDPSEQVTIDTPTGISNRNALRLVCERAGVDYTIANQVVKITSRGQADHYQSVRVYRLSDQLPKNGDPDALVETITSTVFPATWSELGGSGSLTVLGSSLVVLQTQRVHEEIQSLLDMLAESGAAIQPK